MIRPPFMARVAAGIALTLVEEARELPSTALSLPMTSVSMLLQTSMRVQQTMTSLAIKGDSAFAFLYPAREQAPWAVFDEDAAGTPIDHGSAYDSRAGGDADRPRAHAGRPPAGASGARGSAPGRFALYSAPDAASLGHGARGTASGAPHVVAAPEIADELDYDNLTLAQLRPRLRSLTAEDLESLLGYEKAGSGRAPFLTMLENRLANVSAK